MHKRIFSLLLILLLVIGAPAIVQRTSFADVLQHYIETPYFAPYPAPEYCAETLTVSVVDYDVNNSERAPLQGAVVTFQNSTDGIHWQNVTTAVSNPTGYASYGYYPDVLGKVYWQGVIYGDSEYTGTTDGWVIVTSTGACSPTTTTGSTTTTTTTTTPLSNSTGGFGTQISVGSNEFVQAYLDHAGSGWKTESPINFDANKSAASANYSYYTQDLTSLDWEYQANWGTTNVALTPSYIFSANYTVNIEGYSFEVVYNVNNGFYGIGGSDSKEVIARAPNGTGYSTYVTNIDKYEFDYLRFMVLNESQNDEYYFLWTVTPQPLTNIQVTSDNAIWAIPMSPNLAVNISLSYTSSNVAFFQYRINQNFTVSAGDYPTNLAFTSNPTGSTNLFNSILQTMQDPFAWIGGQVARFISSVLTNGFKTLLGDLGLGWITQAVTYFISIVLIMFVIIESIMPYLGFILLLMNVYYVVGMDFEGLMNFYMNIYSVASTMVGALIGFATLVYDFFSSLFGGGSGSATAAAAAA